MATRTMPVLGPADVRRLRRDGRFRTAQQQRFLGDTWRSAGRCLSEDPELFFPATMDDLGPALAVCRTCPVQGPCLAAALDSGDFDGVWGGTTPDERRAMRQVWDLPVQHSL